MTRTEFLSRMELGLSQLPEEEIRNHLDFYEEAIADRMEEGMTQEEAVADLGDPMEAARQILEELPLHTLVKTRMKPEKGWTRGAVVLIVLGAPLWISLLIAAVSVVGVLYLSLWALVLSLHAAAFSLGLGGITGVLASFVLIGAGMGKFLAALGLGLLALALCCLCLPLALYLTKALIRGTGWCCEQIKKMLIKS